MKSSSYMHVVINAAKRAAAAGEVPVAAAVVDSSGQIVVIAENRMKRDAKSTSHAELLALEAAMSITGNSRLKGYDLWVSLEPCAMCAGAIAHARIRRLYFAATDQKGGAVESGVRFFDSPACHHKPEIYSGIQAVAAQQLLTDFFKVRR